MTITQPSSDIESAIRALVREQYGHGATDTQVTGIVTEFKRTAGVENETTNKVPD